MRPPSSGSSPGCTPWSPQSGSSWAHLGILIPPTAAWYLASAAARTGWTGTRRRVSAGLLWRLSLVEWPVYLVLVAGGSLYGLTVSELGAWALLLAAMPYGFVHVSFNRLAAASATHRQTIRALGRVPEAGGFSPPGHAARSADMAVALGGEMGLSPGDARGSWRTPPCWPTSAGWCWAAGRWLPAGDFTTSDLAHWSAAIIAEAPTLQPVAALVAESPRPYRRPGEARDPSLPLAAQVVKVATAYDYAVGGGMEPGDALEVLHGGVAYDYDPDVLAALRRVLQRRGEAKA